MLKRKSSTLLSLNNMGCHTSKDEPSAEQTRFVPTPPAAVVQPPQPLETTTPLEKLFQEAKRGTEQLNTITLAEEYAECSICFDPLHEAPCVTLHRGPHRSCRHLLHEKCVSALQLYSLQHRDAACCPECRGEFDNFQRLPPLELHALESWFRAVDCDRDGRLSRWEVNLVLKAQCKLDWDALEKHIDGPLWDRWDTDGSGFIEFSELCHPGGLLPYIIGVSDRFAYFAPLAEPPALASTAAWFRFWDGDQNGCLDKAEIRRALIKTFNLGNHNSLTIAKRCTMEESLQVAWPLFDPEGRGEIDLEAFAGPGGFGETIALSVCELTNEEAQSTTGLATPLGSISSWHDLAWRGAVGVVQAPVDILTGYIARPCCKANGEGGGDANMAWREPPGLGGARSLARRH